MDIGCLDVGLHIASAHIPLMDKNSKTTIMNKQSTKHHCHREYRYSRFKEKNYIKLYCLGSVLTQGAIIISQKPTRK